MHIKLHKNESSLPKLDAELQKAKDRISDNEKYALEVNTALHRGLIILNNALKAAKAKPGVIRPMFVDNLDDTAHGFIDIPGDSAQSQTIRKNVEDVFNNNWAQPNINAKLRWSGLPGLPGHCSLEITSKK